MNKLRNRFFSRRALASACAVAVLAGTIMSAAGTFLHSQIVNAQAAEQRDYSFTWRNAGTIVSGNKIYYDSYPYDDNKTYENPAAGRCKFGNKDVARDRIYADSMTRGRHFNVDATKKNGLGQETCEEDNYPVTASNPNYAKVMLYQSGDNLVRYDGKTMFTKVDAKVNTSDGQGDLYVRSGESNEPCPDVVVHGTGGKYGSAGWVLFAMAPTNGLYADSNSGPSDAYNRLNVKKGDTCWIAPVEIGVPYEANLNEHSDWGTMNLISDVVNPDLSQGIAGNAAFEPSGIYGAAKFVMGVPTAEQAGPPPGAEPPPGVSEGEDQGPPTSCDIAFNFATALGFKWIVCPFVNILMSTISWLEDFLTTQLLTDTTPLADNGGYHQVWGSFRTIALGLIVIVALVMIIFEAAGVEAFSAYTVRTLFARFGIAVLFIVLSWSILVQVIVIVNDITEGARTIIYSPFHDLPGGDLGGGASFMLLLLGTGGILALGPWGLLSFVLTAVMAIFVTVLVLVAVHSLTYILIMTSPAWGCLKILPITKKAGDFCQNALTSILVGLIAVAFAMPALDVIAGSTYSLGNGGTLQQIIALLIKFMRVFVILFIFSRVGGALSTITGMINDRSRGAFDRLKKFRGDQMRGRHQERMEGSSKLFGSERLAGAYRRAGSVKEGGLSFMQRGRARYEAAEEKRQAALRAKRLEEDHGRAAGNDEANEVAMRDGMNRSAFVEQYIQLQWDRNRKRVTSQQAEKALAELEAGYGAKIGTGAMQATAFQALMASNTSYKPDPNNPDAHYEQMTADMLRMVRNGNMSAADATAIFKANKARADRAGASFGTTIGQLESALESGATEVDAAGIAAIRKSVLDGSNPGSIVGGRPEAVAALAPEMLARVERARQNADNHPEDATAQQEFQRQLASVAGLYDAMAQAAPQNAAIMAEQVLGKTITGADGTPMVLQQVIEQHRTGTTGRMVLDANGNQVPETFNNQSFLNMRREYGSAYGRQAEAQREMVGRGMEGP